MRRICTLGVCVLAVVALGAVAAGSAAAASPEYLTCAKVKNSGKYSNKTCSEANAKGEGKYERVPLTKAAKFKGTVGAVNIYLYEPKNTEDPVKGHFGCKSGKYSGSISNSREGALTITYSECESKGKLIGPCNSPHGKSGVVTTSTLASKLVWLNEAETEPGIEFKAKSGGIAAVECSSIETAELVGTMLAKIAPTKETSKDQTITMNASSTTGEPELPGWWEGGMPLSESLKSNLKGSVENYEGVPTSQSSVFSQKGPDVLIS